MVVFHILNWIVGYASDPFIVILYMLGIFYKYLSYQLSLVKHFRKSLVCVGVSVICVFLFGSVFLVPKPGKLFPATGPLHLL